MEGIIGNTYHLQLIVVVLCLQVCMDSKRSVRTLPGAVHRVVTHVSTPEESIAYTVSTVQGVKTKGKEEVK